MAEMKQNDKKTGDGLRADTGQDGSDEAIA